LKLIYIIIFSSIYLFSSTIYSQNIAIINIQALIDNNKIYKNIVKEIESTQQSYLKNFNLKENELKSNLKEIEESKLILSEDEINLRINNYNIALAEFTNLVQNFNSHYQNEIIIIRKLILKEIIILLEKYVIENNLDLVLDSNSYLIASNSLDITNDINVELEKLNFNLGFKNFE